MTARAALRQGSGVASAILSRRSDPWTANRAASAPPAIHDVLLKQPQFNGHAPGASNGELPASLV
jgi:hypothetical protein